MDRPPEPFPHRLRIYLIKPSKYDDQGRVMTFWKGILPSNTLTVLNALALAWNDHRPADLPTRVETVLWDELVHGAVGPRLLETLRRETAEPGVRAAVFVCGAQTNEYFRARDIAVWFREHGFDALVGGFHISGHRPSREYLQARGVTTVVGEAEAQISTILEDLVRGRLRRHYEHTSGLRAKTGKDPIWVPEIEDAPLPVLDPDYLTRFMNPSMTTLDTSRGCPFTCSYCSVKNVMGRTMRARDPRRVKEWVRRAHDEQGIRYLFLVDDDFYRNPRWEEVLDGLIELRRSGRAVGFMMQVDVEASGGMAREGGERAARARRFLDKSAAAGCYQVFVGFESFDPSNLEAASKSQNRRLHQPADAEEARAQVVESYRRVVANWHEVGVAVHGAGMIGFPWDEADAGRRMARDFIDIRLDQASFFIVTPLPGTEDWDQALDDRRVVDFDFDHYETTRPVARHPRMSAGQLVAAYHEAIDTFYHPKRLLTYLLTNGWNRSLSAEARRNSVRQFLWYYFSRLRNRHPMIGGFWRRPGDTRERLWTPLPAATGGAPSHLERLFAELRAWRAELAAAACRPPLGTAAEGLLATLNAALVHLQRDPVVEDAGGVRPLAYLAPHLEALARAVRELASSAENTLSRARLAALHEEVGSRLQQLWSELRRFGAVEAQALEELLAEWRLGVLALRAGPTSAG